MKTNSSICNVHTALEDDFVIKGAREAFDVLFALLEVNFTAYQFEVFVGGLI